MCPRTTFAVAFTVLNVEQSILEHTLKARTSPVGGGPVRVRAGSAAAGGASCGAKPYQCSRSPRRRNAWNCWATDRAGGESDATRAAAGGWIVSPSSWKLELTPNVPAADCGTRRYSTESIADALAGKMMHPESRIGSTETNESTARATWKPRPAAHTGNGTGRGAIGWSLHAASSSDDAPTHIRAVRRSCSFL